MERLAELYRQHVGESPERIVPIAGAGSHRCYFRLSGKRSLVGTVGTDRSENRAFIALSRHFHEAGLPVPEVVAVAADDMCYLQTDAGNRSLYEAVSAADCSAERRMELLGEAVDILARFHRGGSEGIDYRSMCQFQAMDSRAVMRDLNYFKYCFLKPSGLEFDEVRLDDEFAVMAAKVAAADADGVLLRDYQSRNLMLDGEGRMTVIDFQGARRGAAQYDLVSLLWQSRLSLSDSERLSLARRYVREADVADPDAFMRSLPLYVLLRTLQTLGTYGFRGLVEKKELFVRSIPKALQTLALLPWHAYSGMPYLRMLVGRLMCVDRFFNRRPSGRLTVTVSSFAYPKGIPDDKSGNGGGYVFDCRAIHNPGRYERYKSLTGRDSEVIEFLKADGEADRFLESAWKLIDMSVRKYITRGFSSLTVSFGCTGGQHRSVYCAEATARHIAETFPEADVDLTHREQHIHETFRYR